MDIKTQVGLPMKNTLTHLWRWFLAGFAFTLGFAAARGLLSWLGWWR